MFKKKESARPTISVIPWSPQQRNDGGAGIRRSVSDTSDIKPRSSKEFYAISTPPGARRQTAVTGPVYKTQDEAQAAVIKDIVQPVYKTMGEVQEVVLPVYKTHEDVLELMPELNQIAKLDSDASLEGSRPAKPTRPPPTRKPLAPSSTNDPRGSLPWRPAAAIATGKGDYGEATAIPGASSPMSARRTAKDPLPCAPSEAPPRRTTINGRPRAPSPTFRGENENLRRSPSPLSKETSTSRSPSTSPPSTRLKKRLEDQPWFHGPITRTTAEARLEAVANSSDVISSGGYFLVREKAAGKSYVVSVLNPAVKDTTQHLVIAKPIRNSGGHHPYFQLDHYSNARFDSVVDAITALMRDIKLSEAVSQRQELFLKHGCVRPRGNGSDTSPTVAALQTTSPTQASAMKMMSVLGKAAKHQQQARTGLGNNAVLVQ